MAPDNQPLDKEENSAQPLRKAGFLGAPDSGLSDADAAIEKSRRDFLAYLAACYFPDQPAAPHKLFPPIIIPMLESFEMDAQPDIAAVAAGTAAIPVRMKIDDTACLIEVKRDSILTSGTLTMEAALEMALLALANPTMQGGIELVGSDEEKQILARAAKAVGLTIKNPPPEIPPDPKSEEAFQLAQQKIDAHIQNHLKRSAAAATAAAAASPAQETAASSAPDQNAEGSANVSTESGAAVKTEAEAKAEPGAEARTNEDLSPATPLAEEPAQERMTAPDEAAPEIWRGEDDPLELSDDDGQTDEKTDRFLDEEAAAEFTVPDDETMRKAFNQEAAEDAKAAQDNPSPPSTADNDAPGNASGSDAAHGKERVKPSAAGFKID